MSSLLDLWSGLTCIEAFYGKACVCTWDDRQHQKILLPMIALHTEIAINILRWNHMTALLSKVGRAAFWHRSHRHNLLGDHGLCTRIGWNLLWWYVLYVQLIQATVIAQWCIMLEWGRWWEYSTRIQHSAGALKRSWGLEVFQHELQYSETRMTQKRHEWMWGFTKSTLHHVNTTPPCGYYFHQACTTPVKPTLLLSSLHSPPRSLHTYMLSNAAPAVVRRVVWGQSLILQGIAGVRVGHVSRDWAPYALVPSEALCCS